MRTLFLAVMLPALLGGCATGYATDWFKDRQAIIAPELQRYGLGQAESACVGDRLSKRLSRQQLRRFQEQAEVVRRPSGNLTIVNLRAVALAMRDKEIAKELDAVAGACAVALSPVGVAGGETSTPGTGEAGTAGGGAPLTSGGVPVDMTPRGNRVATWLNLGAAESGQSIAVDAMSIEQDGPGRVAWFRMTDPESGTATNNHYRLRVDCDAKTIQPLALRRFDAAGTQTSLREYTPEEAKAGPAESGTVLEIAFLSLCT